VADKEELFYRRILFRTRLGRYANRKTVLMFPIVQEDVRATVGMCSPLMQIYLANLYSVDAKR
jgi:hypothetical protein